MAEAAGKRRLRVGMVGLGMIFEETYRPLIEQLHVDGLFRRDTGLVKVELEAVATRTGRRAEQFRERGGRRVPPCQRFHGPNAVASRLPHAWGFVCLAW